MAWERGCGRVERRQVCQRSATADDRSLSYFLVGTDKFSEYAQKVIWRSIYLYFPTYYRLRALIFEVFYNFSKVKVHVNLVINQTSIFPSILANYESISCRFAKFTYDSQLAIYRQ